MERIDVDAVMRAANGQWAYILEEIGVDKQSLSGKHSPCPACGGTDRFRFDDKEGRGTSFCNLCLARNGMGLFMELKGMEFIPAVREVAAILSMNPVAPGQIHAPSSKPRPSSVAPEKAQETLIKVWKEAKPATPNGEVDRYLKSRGLVLPALPADLMWHPRMRYVEEATGKHLGTYSAMLAVVRDVKGRGISYHRTYLDHGQKAKIANSDGNLCPSKKLMSGRESVSGCAIRLFAPAETLGVAEGIETSLAIFLKLGLPVWAGISATIMGNMMFPEMVRKVIIFSDYDLPDVKGRRAGQDNARKLAERLIAEGREAEIRVPDVEDTDFRDQYFPEFK